MKKERRNEWRKERRRREKEGRKGTSVLKGHVSLTTPLDELAKCAVC